MKPTLRILSRIKDHFAIHWKDIGYELLITTPKDVEIIESTNKSESGKCFDMLKRWMETDTNACYSKLINALRVYNLEDAAEMIMDKIEGYQHIDRNY